MRLLQVNSSNKPFDYWVAKNSYYHSLIARFYKFVIPPDSKVLHLGCKNGYLLEIVKPKRAVGIEADNDSLLTAKIRYPDYDFYNDIEELKDETFDYIIISSHLMEVEDIQEVFEKLYNYCESSTRLVIDWYSALWEPILWVTQKLRLRRQTELKNWVSLNDVKNFLHLASFEVVMEGRHIIVPLYIPGISALLNSIVSNIPGIDRLCLGQWIIARPIINKLNYKPSVSIIIPCRNEMGNIEPAVTRIPNFDAKVEIIFVEGHSRDDTIKEIERIMEKNPEKNIKFFVQDNNGKGDAVRKGFANATGDILMIQDADLTAPPEELIKFYNALASNKGEFINGSRLVYGMENQAMRFLNLIVNYFFGILFSWLLGQKLKDTLCGTKVLYKKDYEKIAKNRDFFGKIDPFGDFDLLFGAAKQNLKIIDLPVHYKNRTYGTTQIRRFYHGLLLFKMSWIAFKKFKFK